MENASKALIIAGAILLAILIIGLGMFIYQQASGAMSGANLDPTKAQAYNSEFLQYEGTKSGTDTIALYNLIKNHNRSNTDDVSLQIAVDVKETDATTTPKALTNTVEPPTSAPTLSDAELKSGKTYYIQFQYSKVGYITKCTITPMK